MASPAIALSNGVAASLQLNNNNANSNPSPDDIANVNANNNSTDAASNANLDDDVNAAPNNSSINNTTAIKRKREPSDVGDKPPNGIDNSRITPTIITAASISNAASASSPSTSGANKDDLPTIRNYYEVLQRLDPIPSVLKRPLPDPEDSPDAPQAKRKKSDDGSSLPSIADKVATEQYEDLVSIIVDIKSSISHQLAELRDIKPEQDTKANDEACAKLIDFKRQAFNLFKREMSYPSNPRVSEALQGLEQINDLQSNASGNVVLTVNGEAMRGKQYYSSLQQAVIKPDGTEAVIQPLKESGLPSGVKVAKAIPYFFPSAVDKDKKSKTLGELFPPPRNLPSLQPPKAPKSTTKGVQVGWHRPELTEKSKYRAGSYFSQNISAGRWLDYSNAAPPSQIMTKQRERALSLAGNKPSSSDLEMSEMEALFRGAFSSFAPSKDDTAAMISSGLISHTMWWQKVGKRNFDRLIEAELPEDLLEEVDKGEEAVVEEVDEDIIQETLDKWDETMIDPSLEEACCPKKPEDQKDVDDLLQDVSDMIQTLVSYQKNRNLTLPSASSQSRYAADPAHSDMLTNGTPVQPGEEEMATYQALKAQLCLVIQMLPPYAVARLNSDKLDELNISTKIEVRTDEYQGSMEEEEAAIRARAAQAPPTNARPPTHRASSSSNALQYGQPYHTSRGPMPNPQFYPQTPIRPPPPTMARPPQTMPANYPPRPPSNTGYRPPPHYPNAGYSQQFTPKAQQYSQPGPYGTPAQPRPPYQPMPGYPNMATSTPPAHFPPSYPPNTQPPPQSKYHHPQYPPQHAPPPHGTPSHAPYPQYANGTGAIPQRTASPHVSHQQPQHQHPHPHPHQPIPHHLGYNPAATPTRQPSYGNQPNMGNDPRRYYANTGSPAVPNNQLVQHGQPNPNPQTPSSSSFQTSLNPHQVQQAMDQAKARFDATKSAQRTTEGIRNSMSGQGQGQVGAPVGLGGIGLGGDPSRLVASRAGVPNYQGPGQTPKAQMNSPAVTGAQPSMNGTPAMSPPGPAANGGQPSYGRES